MNTDQHEHPSDPSRTTGEGHSHDHSTGQGHGHGHGHSTGGAGHGHSSSDAGLDDLLDLDGLVLSDYWDTALDLVTDTARSLASGSPSGGVRLVDLGAGTGTGALGLARRWPQAEVVAVDVSQPALDRVTAKATEAGVGDRVRTVAADLDAGWPDLGPVDLTWASMSLHHLSDPTATLEQLRAATRAGGVVGVAEFDEPLRFLPKSLGVSEPGFESRLMELMGRVHAEAVPAIGSPWAQLLTEAGWTVVEQRALTIDEQGSGHPLTGRYARAWFERLAEGVGDRLADDDRATLAALLDDEGPHALLHRRDLHLHGIRTVTVARA